MCTGLEKSVATRYKQKHDNKYPYSACTQELLQINAYFKFKILFEKNISITVNTSAFSSASIFANLDLLHQNEIKNNEKCAQILLLFCATVWNMETIWGGITASISERTKTLYNSILTELNLLNLFLNDINGFFKWCTFVSLSFW